MYFHRFLSLYNKSGEAYDYTANNTKAYLVYANKQIRENKKPTDLGYLVSEEYNAAFPKISSRDTLIIYLVENLFREIGKDRFQVDRVNINFEDGLASVNRTFDSLYQQLSQGYLTLGMFQEFEKILATCQPNSAVYPDNWGSVLTTALKGDISEIERAAVLMSLIGLTNLGDSSNDFGNLLKCMWGSEKAVALQNVSPEGAILNACSLSNVDQATRLLSHFSRYKLNFSEIFKVLLEGKMLSVGSINLLSLATASSKKQLGLAAPRSGIFGLGKARWLKLQESFKTATTDEARYQVVEDYLVKYYGKDSGDKQFDEILNHYVGKQNIENVQHQVRRAQNPDIIIPAKHQKL